MEPSPPPCLKLSKKRLHQDSSSLRERIHQDENLSGLSKVDQAVHCCMNGWCSQRAAASFFDLTQSQVKRGVKAWKTGRDIGRNGHPPLLRKSQEKVFKEHILKSKKPLTFSDLCQQGENIRKSDGLPSSPFSATWARNFVNRTSELKALIPKTAEAKRFLMKSEIDSWFEKHGELLQSIHPSLLANFDETMVSPSSKKAKVVVKSDINCVVLPVMNSPNHITFCPTIFADGTFLIPMVIFPLVNVPNVSA